MRYLSMLSLDASRWEVVHDLGNRDRLHKKVMRLFPEVDAQDPRRRMGILFRLEKDRMLLQSSTPPDPARAAPGYRVLTTKDVTEAYARVRTGREYRFRLDANTSWRVDEQGHAPADIEWIPNADVQVKKAQRRVGCGSYPERARWFEQRMGFIGARPGIYFMESLPLLQVKGGVLEATRFDGHLEILDLERFRRALHDGVGQGKAYGLGMLSLA